MKFLVQLLSLLIVTSYSIGTLASIVSKKLPSAGVVSPDTNSFIDPEADYRRFSGRVTDKDQRGRVFKIQVENNNTKFFRVGDVVYFRVSEKNQKTMCKGFVRATEDFYFSIYVESLHACYPEGEYFKRGTVLFFESDVLVARVFEASKFREQLLIKKDNFLKQLNDINHFLWSFDQAKIKTAADYDQQIVELQKAKQRALDGLITEKSEQLTLQTELMQKLNELDDSLKYYRIERQELLMDRWNMDHDNGLPFGHRPQPLKIR